MKRFYLFIVCFFTSITLLDAQSFPGGVTDAEVWYIADLDDLGNGVFNNSSLTDIKLKNCGDYKKSLFNFNSSLFSEKLCIKYPAPLENSTGRDVFFVGEPKSTKSSVSHLGTLWNPSLSSIAETDSIVRNFFDVNNMNAYAPKIYGVYNSDKNANVNFYHTNHYNIDKKFKSFGQLGETDFYIGTKVAFDPDSGFPDNHFFGNFPEFISFTRELSANERMRVVSYLALKYGLTLDKKVPYLSSENKVFWSNDNNKIFPNRIFGFGKDVTSTLNQLQSESTHLKKHLVAAIGKIAETNMDKQEMVDLPNEHFLVFGDNGGKPKLSKENSKKIKYWEKVWLAQRTGKKMSEYPIYFRLTLTDELQEYLSSNKDQTLWLLKDNHIGNNVVSDFEGEHIEYHPGNVNLDQGFADFEKISFDQDVNIFDQYTFGVGPRMIVQAQVSGCKGEKQKITIVITGGKPKYSINVESEANSFDVVTSNTTYTFDGEVGVEYNITVTDAQGLVGEVVVTPNPWNFNLNLGPDQSLTPANPEIILDASVGITDPNATYQWYQDGVLLPYTGSALVVTEAGDYKVVVTSEDLACTIEDKITIFNNGIEAFIEVSNACGDGFNVIHINIEDGMPTYITSLEGVNGTVNYAHSGSTILEDIDYGTYLLTITDSQGVTYEQEIVLLEPVELDIYGQLEAICDLVNPTYCINYDYSWDDIAEPFFNYTGNMGTFSLDASNGNSNPNVTYEWWESGELIGTSPVMTFTAGNLSCYVSPTNPNSAGGNPIYTAIATDNFTGCVYEQTFITKGICADGNQAPIVENNIEKVSSEDILITNLEDPENEDPITENSSQSIALDLTTKVYPNPANSGTTFTYLVTSESLFDGIVEIFTSSGERLYSADIKGDTSYRLPFNIDMPGIYFIKVTSSIGVSKIERIIIN